MIMMAAWPQARRSDRRLERGATQNRGEAASSTRESERKRESHGGESRERGRERAHAFDVARACPYIGGTHVAKRVGPEWLLKASGESASESLRGPLDSDTVSDQCLRHEHRRSLWVNPDTESGATGERSQTHWAPSSTLQSFPVAVATSYAASFTVSMSTKSATVFRVPS